MTHSPSAQNSARAWQTPPIAVIGLLVFAFLLRVVFLLLAGVNAPLTGDELAYQQIAEHFAAGRGLFQDNNPFFPGQPLYAWQAPLYPLAIGVLYALAGPNLLLAKLFGVLVSAATVYVVYDFSRRVFRITQNAPAEKIAFAAAFLIAIYPGFLTHAHLLLSETLFVFLLLLAFDFSARALDARTASRAWLWLFGAGALWGLATLTRGITLYFTPLCALWLGVMWRRGTQTQNSAGDQNRAALARAILAAAVFVGAAGLVIAPYTARNYFQFGQFVLLETKGGVNLWLGNSPYTPDDFIRNVWKVGVREPMLNGLPQDELQRDRAAYAHVLDYLRAEPVTFFARMPVKFADLWGFERNLIDIAKATTRGAGWNSFSKIAADAFAIVVYVFVMLCGAAGFVLARDDAWKILLGGFVLYFMFVHLAIFGDGRFHLPLIPFFAMYAGWLMVQFRRVEFSRARVVLAALLILALLLVWTREAWVAFQVLDAG